jgi:hypothetical protein
VEGLQSLKSILFLTVLMGGNRVDFDPQGDALLLISANPSYGPRRFAGQELEAVRIAGWVVACHHRV